MGKPAPQFWWKIDLANKAIVVHSDYPGGRNLDTFKAPLFTKYLDIQILQAEHRIADYVSGRATPNWNKDDN